MDTLAEDERLARNTIHTLARLQGTGYDPRTEEEKGRILHERRATSLDGEPIPEECLKIMRELQEKWGDPDSDEMIYYGSCDSTLLYVLLVEQFAARYGNGILQEPYTNKDGEPRVILDSVESAVNDWLVPKLYLRSDRLLAYKRINPKGIENQVWKDSDTAYLFSDGTAPSFEHDIVSTELEGYSYDVLLYAARLFPQRAPEYLALARQVQQSTLDKLWMPEEQFFAQGLGMHVSGVEKPLDTITSNGGLIMNSDLLKHLPRRRRNRYLDGIERMVLGPEMYVPDAGVRCRSVRHIDLLPFVDYHGSQAVWDKENRELAKGFQRLGRMASALILSNNILNNQDQAPGKFMELNYVGRDNTVYRNPEEAAIHLASPEGKPKLTKPQERQTWTITAAFASAHHVLGTQDKSALAAWWQVLQEAWPPRAPRPRRITPSFARMLASIPAVMQNRVGRR